jgi:hypothetical protein
MPRSIPMQVLIDAFEDQGNEMHLSECQGTRQSPLPDDGLGEEDELCNFTMDTLIQQSW